MFAAISLNWRGRPLTTYETIVELIGATTTKTGLTIECALDCNSYPTGIKVTDEELAAVNLTPDDQNLQWNYTIRPRVSKMVNRRLIFQLS